MRYFLTLPKGAESHTVLVQDIPGVPFGTQVQRVASLAPKFIADKVRPPGLGDHDKTSGLFALGLCALGLLMLMPA